MFTDWWQVCTNCISTGTTLHFKNQRQECNTDNQHYKEIFCCSLGWHSHLWEIAWLFWYKVTPAVNDACKCTDAYIHTISQWGTKTPCVSVSNVTVSFPPTPFTIGWSINEPTRPPPSVLSPPVGPAQPARIFPCFSIPLVIDRLWEWRSEKAERMRPCHGSCATLPRQLGQKIRPIALSRWTPDPGSPTWASPQLFWCIIQLGFFSCRTLPVIDTDSPKLSYFLHNIRKS